MDANLNEEQVILRETVAQLAADLAPESPEQLPAKGPGEKEWLQLAEMGLLGMRLPESAGGMPTSGTVSRLPNLNHVPFYYCFQSDTS